MDNGRKLHTGCLGKNWVLMSDVRHENTKQRRIEFSEFTTMNIIVLTHVNNSWRVEYGHAYKNNLTLNTVDTRLILLQPAIQHLMTCLSEDRDHSLEWIHIDDWMRGMDDTVDSLNLSYALMSRQLLRELSFWERLRFLFTRRL